MGDLSTVTNGLALDRVSRNWVYRDEGARWLSVALMSCPPAMALRTERAMFAACEAMKTRSRVTAEL